MKKIIIFILIFLVVSIISWLGLGVYVDSRLESAQNKYARLTEKDFAEGITLDEAKALFPKYGAKFNILECGNEVYSETSCPGSFRTVLVFPLEGNIILGEGYANAYLYFDNDGKFESHELIVFYVRYH